LQSGIEAQEWTALCEKDFGSVGQETEVTHAHEAFGDDEMVAVVPTRLEAGS